MRKLLAVLALAGMAACGGGGSSPVAPPLDPLAGTYQLASVNGSLPYLVSDVQGLKHWVNGGTLTIDAVNHEFAETVSESYVQATTARVGTTQLFGSYSVQGSALTLTLAATLGSGVLPATIAGQQITVTSGTQAQLFRKLP
jgi:hypothetical protein